MAKLVGGCGLVLWAIGVVVFINSKATASVWLLLLGGGLMVLTWILELAKGISDRVHRTTLPREHDASQQQD